jgi:lactoylglutathione lyase
VSTSGPSSPRLTHVALPVHDLEASLDWYRRWTPLAVLHDRRDDEGRTAWIGHPTDPNVASHPFVLVLIEKATQSDAPTPILAPLAHLGFEMPTRAAVDDVAREAREAGILHWDAADLGGPVGYVCAVLDPDGNVVEFSHDQGVYAAAQTSEAPPANV